MSLRFRLVGILGLTLCLLWAAAAAWLAHELQDRLNRVLDQRLAASARMVATIVEQLPGTTGTLGTAELSIPATRGIACQVRSASGNLIARTTTRLGATAELPEPGFGYRRVDGDRWRLFTQRIEGYSVTTADRMAVRRERRQALLLVAALPFGAALAGSLALLWWGVGRGLAPLARLRRALASRDPASLQPVATPGLPRELLPLTHTINGLLERMEDALERERRFTNDAAHELRTPLAGIKTHLQIARQARGEQAHHALQQADEATDRLTNTLQQLLTLARLDARSDWDEAATAPARACVEAIVADLPAAERERIETDLEAGDPAAATPHELVMVALRNLVHNALRHGPAERPVRIDVHVAGDYVTFEVANEGDGLAAAELERLTERFRRNPGSHGSGLGLSITAAIVERAGGQLTFANRDGGGLLARMVLPVATPMVDRGNAC